MTKSGRATQTPSDQLSTPPGQRRRARFRTRPTDADAARNSRAAMRAKPWPTLGAAKGLTNPAIGVELDIANKTVAAHVEHILAKLNASRRAEIGAWAATVRPGEGVRD